MVLCGVVRPVSADNLVATFVYPINGAREVDLSRVFEWTAVENAQTYYLCVGSSPGAKDLVNSGEIRVTRFAVGELPVNQLLYARIWTRAAGSWRFSDVSFTAAPRKVASFLYPASGASNVDLDRPFAWTAVPNASCYYLYVGSTPGTKDLVNTGEIQETTRVVSELPAGQTLYARLWTRFAGAWRYTDMTFTVAPRLAAVFRYPTNGATGVDLGRPLEWTSVPNAQAYYVYVGTAAGAKDLLDSSEILQTSYTMATLPANRPVYARLWTRISGRWRYRDISFTAAPPKIARFIYPAHGAAGVDLRRPLEWTSVQDVEAYYLYLGSSAGAKDLLSTGELRQTTYLVNSLPTDCTIHARLWTKVAGRWRYADTEFTAAPRLVASFIYPQHGMIGVDVQRPFAWTGVPDAEAYFLQIGRSRGASDVRATGEIQETSRAMSGLPDDVTLHARIWTKAEGVWRYSDAAFTLAVTVAPAESLYPVSGSTEVDGTHWFEWSSIDLARAYRLTIGSAPGATDWHDSGAIRVSRRFVPDLPVGVPLFGRVETQVAGQWSGTDFTFTLATNGRSPEREIEAALWAMSFVRSMADLSNNVFPGTELQDHTYWLKRSAAYCYDYAKVLGSVLGQVNVGASRRFLTIAFNTNKYDVHILLEFWHEVAQKWILLDPTFALTVKRPDGAWATAEDVLESVLERDSDNGDSDGDDDSDELEYLFVDGNGYTLARRYYLDYPTLFLNQYRANDQIVYGQGRSPLPYLQEVATPVNTFGVYNIQCGQGTEATVLVDDEQRSIACDGIDSLSKLFWAKSIAPVEGHSVRVFTPRRETF